MLNNLVVLRKKHFGVTDGCCCAYWDHVMCTNTSPPPLKSPSHVAHFVVFRDRNAIAPRSRVAYALPRKQHGSGTSCVSTPRPPITSPPLTLANLVACIMH